MSEMAQPLNAEMIARIERDIAKEFLPLVGFAAELELAIGRKPMLVVPPHIAPGLQELRGYRVIHAAVRTSLVAFERP